MIAVLYAIRQEIAPFLACIKVSDRFERDGAMFYKGDLNGLPLMLVQGGVGRKNAIKSARSLLTSAKVDLLISSGVAGGLKQGLKVGDLVVADRICYSKQNDFDSKDLQLESDYACNKEIVELAGQLSNGTELYAHFGNLLTVDNVISQASTKRRIGVQGAFAAVEMESAAVAEVAHEHGVDFAAVRAISDDREDDLHLDYDNIMSDEGKIKVTGIALEILKNPQKLALLKRLNKQTKTASRNLAIFMSKLVPYIYENKLNMPPHNRLSYDVRER